jgi:ribosomal protein S27AE
MGVQRPEGQFPGTGGFAPLMGYRLYPGCGCPRCGEQLTHHRRLSWTLFFRQSYLRCSNCGFTAYKRTAHRTTDRLEESGPVNDMTEKRLARMDVRRMAIEILRRGIGL